MAMESDVADITCPECGHESLLRGRYDDPDGDSIPWAVCLNLTCTYESEG